MTHLPAARPHKPVTPDPWQLLSRFTAARIGLGRAGASLPTRALLAFQLDHARARDAVLRELDSTGIENQLQALRMPALRLQSGAPDRATFIARPDLGRVLEPRCAELLARQPARDPPWDVVIVLADGLSALAVEKHAMPLLQLLLPRIAAEGWSLAPVCIVRQGRVAVADHIGNLLGARLSVILIGERPGLSSPDSLGIYLTWKPRQGRSNAERNCVSNVREPGGLAYAQAAHKLHYLMTTARRLEFSGIALKEDAAAKLPDAKPEPPTLPLE